MEVFTEEGGEMWLKAPEKNKKVDLDLRYFCHTKEN